MKSLNNPNLHVWFCYAKGPLLSWGHPFQRVQNSSIAFYSQVDYSPGYWGVNAHCCNVSAEFYFLNISETSCRNCRIKKSFFLLLYLVKSIRRFPYIPHHEISTPILSNCHSMQKFPHIVSFQSRHRRSVDFPINHRCFYCLMSMSEWNSYIHQLLWICYKGSMAS